MFSRISERLSRYHKFFLLSPLLFFLIFFFFGPLLWLFRVSLYQSRGASGFGIGGADGKEGGGFYVEGTWTIENYVRFFQDEYFRDIMFFTVELAFIVTDPFLFVPQYKMVLNDDEKNQLKIKSTESVLVRVIVTIPKIHSKMTANLVAPLVINRQSRLAKQVVLTSAEYDTKHLLMPRND